MKIVPDRPWSHLWLFLLCYQPCQSADFTLGMDSETSCSKTQYYEQGDVFKASANGMVYGGSCPLTFIQGSTWRNDREAEPCLSLCIKIVSYTMESCHVEMAYSDGLNDYNPVTFDCHTFPPVMWCSSKTDLKVTVTELESYQGKNYAITLEIKPFCGKYDHPTTDTSVIAEPQSKPSQMNQAVVIIGAVVGTISILFVCGWLLYCYKKRQAERELSSGRESQGQTSNQQATRYTPVERNPPSSQSSSDRVPYRPPQENYQPPENPPNFNQDRRLYSPFQPPVTTKGMSYNPDHGPPPFYSDLDRGPIGGNKWYPMTQLGPAQTEPDQPVKFSLPSDPVMPYNPQQVYKYPQFNQDSEMHTAPTDTRYVVYDFDYSRPMERTYSAGKSRTSPHRDSPVKDLANYQRKQREITPPYDFSQRPREITPLRETVRVMHPDTTTTDHTSDNESSISDSSDYATDDQYIPTRPYYVGAANAVQNRGGYRPNNPNISNVRYYDPANFERIDSSRGVQQGKIQEPSGFQKTNGYGQIDKGNKNGIESDRGHLYSSSPPKPMSPLSYTDFVPPAKEGPVPQVPPMPRNFSRPQASSSLTQAQIPSLPTSPLSQAQDSQAPQVAAKPRKGSGPKLVPSSKDNSVPQPSAIQTNSGHHDPSPEREGSWPQGGPPPYSEEQAHLV